MEYRIQSIVWLVFFLQAGHEHLSLPAITLPEEQSSGEEVKG